MDEADPNFKWITDHCEDRQAFICKAPATQNGNTNCPDCGDATEPPGVCKWEGTADMFPSSVASLANEDLTLFTYHTYVIITYIDH